VIDDQQSQIDNLLNLLQTLGDYDLTAPTFASAFIRADSLFVTLNGSDIHQDSIPPTTAFYLTEGLNEMGVTSLTLSDSLLTFKLDSAGSYGATYLVDYTRGIPALQDSSGNKVANRSNLAVTNNVAAPPPPPGDYPAVLDDGDTWGLFMTSDINNITQFTPADSLIEFALGWPRWYETIDSTRFLVASGSQKWYGDSIVKGSASYWFTELGADSINQGMVVYMVVNSNVINNYSNLFYGRDAADIGVRYNAGNYYIETIPGGISSTIAKPTGWHIIKYVINGASSTLTINNNTPVTFAAHSTRWVNRLRFDLGAIDNAYSEIIVRTSLDGQADIYTYLSNKYGI